MESSRLSEFQQGDKCIKDYYGEYSQLWDELSIFEPKWRNSLNIILGEK